VPAVIRFMPDTSASMWGHRSGAALDEGNQKIQTDRATRAAEPLDHHDLGRPMIFTPAAMMLRPNAARMRVESSRAWWLLDWCASLPIGDENVGLTRLRVE
jgi:hypothetical protein